MYCEATPLHLVGERGRLRQVMEICTVPPQLSDDEFVLEPLFRREALGEPLEYCGPAALGAELERRLNRGLPRGITVRDLCEGTATPAVTLLIAFLAAVATFLLVTGATRRPIRAGTAVAAPDRRRRPELELRLRQAGVSLSPARYRATVAGSMAAMFVVGYGLTGTLALAVVPAAVVGFAPRAYYRRRQRKALAARMAAWPEAIRDVLSHITVGSTLHSALVQLGRSGPEPLRPVWRRYAVNAQVLEVSAALEQARERARRPGLGPGDRGLRRRPRTRPHRRRRRAAHPRR